jgi:hypothetical protein
MESLDYRYFTVHVNKGSAKPRASDGRVHVVVAHADPGDGLKYPYNWINTCNHGQGQMLWRWVKVDAEYDVPGKLPQPECRVVKWVKGSGAMLDLDA